MEHEISSDYGGRFQALEQQQHQQQHQQWDDDDDEPLDENALTLVTKWAGREFTLLMAPSSTVSDLKQHLESLTLVAPRRQKLLGLKYQGRAADDSVCLSLLQLKPGHKLMMMGTPDELALRPPTQEELEAVLDDFDYDYFPSELEFRQSRANQFALEKCIAKTTICLINSPRPNKKLLVLDLDHTLLHFSDKIPSTEEMKRPGLEEFMTAAYQNFDLVVWSQTSWKWIEIKLTELGLLASPNYKIAFVLDKAAMFTVTTTKEDGTDYSHQVKALQIIWSKVPSQYSAANTIHVDDLSKNFAMNPQNGLKVEPFHSSAESLAADRELPALQLYLQTICQLPDFSHLDHKDWKKMISPKS